ncbi:MAG: heme ABC exporter ATP-binding protein CcmA [Acidimicrobiales bacterium]
MASVIELRAAVALTGGFPALAGVDLTVDPGEVLLLSGPNGAGKTTLLRLCAGLVALTSGRARVLGHDLATDRRTVRRQVGLLGHSGFLYEDLTVEDNLRFWARSVGAPAEGIEECMARLGLDGRLRRVPVARLSAGQRRRVSVAALLARRPRLWLLDEPHAGLDFSGRDVLDRLITEAAAAGCTVMMSSHEPDRAGHLATRAVQVAGGRIVEPSRDPTPGPDREPTSVA